MQMLSWLGRCLARYLEGAARSTYAHAASDLQRVGQALEPADVLLVDGKRRISVAIKYLTHSHWSHAALYVGPRLGPAANGEVLSLVEADAVEGVRAVALSEYAGHRLRICRPRGLSEVDREKVLAYAIARIGHQYDLHNVWDLARYLFPTPPVPWRWHRRMIALGSSDPTRAICSTLIALAFQSVRYPILPIIEQQKVADPACRDCLREQWHIRHHSLFVPADFDNSPYFDIVKPELSGAFDYRRIPWAEAPRAAVASMVLKEAAVGGADSPRRT